MPNNPESAEAQNHVDRLADGPSLADQLSVDDGIYFEPEAATLDLQVPDL